MLKSIDKKMSEPIGPVGLAVAIAVTGLFMYGLDTVFDSENNLSRIKRDRLVAPPISQQCDPDVQLDMACWTQITREMCDGNNTLDRSDDVCETIEFWNYVEPVNVMR